MTIFGLLFLGAGGLTALLVSFVSPTARREKALFLVLYPWHTLMCVFYYLTFRNDVVDAVAYYHEGYHPQPFGLGTQFIFFTTSAVRGVVPTATFLDIFLLWNIIGYLGLVFFCLAAIQISWRHFRELRPWIWLATLLPGMSFWSSALGKEPIMFLGIQLTLWASLNLSTRFVWALVGTALAFMVRPHIAAVLAAALVVAYLLSQKRGVTNVLIGAVLATGAYFVLPLALGFLQIGALDTATITEFVTANQKNLAIGGSAIDIQSYSLPAKIGSYLYRPTVFETYSLSTALASIENLIFVILTLVLLRNAWVAPAKPWLRFPMSAFVLFFVVGVGTSAFLTGNLGMAMRQKYQFMPSLLLIMLAGKSMALTLSGQPSPMPRHVKTAAP